MFFPSKMSLGLFPHWVSPPTPAPDNHIGSPCHQVILNQVILNQVILNATSECQDVASVY